MPLRPPAGFVSSFYDPLKNPNAPTVGTASAGDAQASVTFTAPSNVGGSAITNYYAVSNPGQITASSVTSPVTVTGLTNGTSYTFTVWALNSFGPSAYSAASGSVTPSPPYIEDVFNTWLFNAGASFLDQVSVNNGVDYTKGAALTITKTRSVSGVPAWVDTVRGQDYSLWSSSTSAQNYQSTGVINGLTSSGFTWLTGSGQGGATVASWTFREQPKFFDIVTFSTGATLSSNRSISHNLGSAPGFIIVKSTSNDSNWLCYHRSLGQSSYVALQSTNAENTTSQWWTATAPTSTTFNIDETLLLNTNRDYVAYLFAHDAGGFGSAGADNVISCGSVTADGSGNATVNLGYEPQWVLIKSSSETNNWAIIDTMRGLPADGLDRVLNANTSGAESGGGLVNINATGFYANATLSASATYIYIAIRRGPMKTPTTGTSVFSPNLSATTTGTTVTTNFPLDLQIAGYRPGLTPNFGFSDRLRGVSSTSTEVANYLTSTNTAAESTALNFRTLAWSNTGYNQDGYLSGSGSGIYWNFRRAPGFFDVVCYTGTGSNLTLNHNLGVTPELIITKRRNGATYGAVYASSLGVDKFLELFSSSTGGRSAAQTFSGSWLTPTSTTFGVGVTDQNVSAATYVAYLFSTVIGVSKVGSYTGNGSSQTINCGFTGGARFVLIKRTNAAGDWVVFDSARGIVSGNDPFLELNTTAAEQTGEDAVDTDSTGFVVNETTENLNVNGASYIFLAIA